MVGIYMEKAGMMTALKPNDIHDKCGLPIQLCVCGGKDDPHSVIDLYCTLCYEKWVGVAPPGVPVKDYQCVKCMQHGYCEIL